jgi:hypothetical protein
MRGFLLNDILQILTALFAISYFYNYSLISQVFEGALKDFSQLQSENNAPPLGVKFVRKNSEEILFPAASRLSPVYLTHNQCVSRV